MSRIIVKNVPKKFTQKQIIAHFSPFAEVTDCKIGRNQNGQSRKFAFIGFKDVSKAQQARKNYHNTYLGASKIQVDIAKSRMEQQNRFNQSQGKDQKKKINIKKQASKKFSQYKKIVKEGIKKSWDDIIAPPQAVEQQQEQEKQNQDNIQNQKKSKKDQLKEKKIAKKQQIQLEAKAIKAPRLSERNKKFLNRPLSIDSSRLYITNLPYQLQQQELLNAFAKFGNVIKVKLPKQYDGKTKGFGFITYQKEQQALRAFTQIDNKILFGRIVHLKPAIEDVGSIIKTNKQIQYKRYLKEKYGDTEEEKSSYKKKKKRQMRQKLNDTTNWNTLFLNPNTILDRVAKKLKISKSQILLSENLAPKVALAQTQVIQETKKWMKQSGLNVDFLQKNRQLCKRSTKIILVKNLNHRTKQLQIRQLFQFYGVINKVLLAPNKAIAIVQYRNEDFAKNAFEKLQYHKFKNNFLYLQYAPIQMMDEQHIEEKIQQLEKQQKEAEQISKVVYVKNLNFQTDENSLYDCFQKIGKVKYAKIVSKDTKSMGYGFVQYQTKQDAQKAVRTLHNQILDGHKLVVSISRKKVQNQQKLKKLKEKLVIQQKASSKLSVKNLAFQATKKDVQQLFKQFGSIKTVRLPKKMDGQHRGFAFVQYDSIQDARLAKQALGNTHLYGRKLVVQYQKGSNQKQ